jgi:hypothetical protein
MLTYFIHKAEQRAEVLSCCCNFIILNVHAPGQDKRDNTKDRYKNR